MQILPTWLAALLGVGIRFENLGRWFAFYATNPYSAATFGAIVSVMTTVVATWLSKRVEKAPV